MIYLIIILIAIILLLFLGTLTQNTKYRHNLTLAKNKLLLYNELYSFYIGQYKHLKEQLENIEEKEYIAKDYFDTIEGFVKKDPIYEGKRALVGDHIPISANNTKSVLRSLGLKVDIVPTGKDIVDMIIYAPENYDIIFCNNIYPNGTGEESLKRLKELNNFSIPVIIHTTAENKRDYFVDRLGFSDYIVKPVTQEILKPILNKLLH